MNMKKKIVILLISIAALFTLSGCMITADTYKTDGVTATESKAIATSGVIKVPVDTNSSNTATLEWFNGKTGSDFSADNSIVMSNSVIRGYFQDSDGNKSSVFNGTAVITSTIENIIYGELVYNYSGLKENTDYTFYFWIDAYIKADESSTSADLHASYCGENNPESVSIDFRTLHTCHGVEFDKVLDSSFTGGELTSGNYSLLEDITLTSELTISEGETVNICLNGHAIYIDGFRLNNFISGTLMICDCSDVERYWKRVTTDYTVYQEVDKTEAEYTSKGGLISSRRTDENAFNMLFQVASTGSITLDGINFIGIKNYYSSQILVNENGTLNVKNCVIRGNDCIKYSTQTYAFFGYYNNANGYITDTVFTDNEVGSVIECVTDKLKIGSNVIIKDNYPDLADKSKGEIGLTIHKAVVSFDDNAKNNDICVLVYTNASIDTTTNVTFTTPSSKDVSSFFRLSNYDRDSGLTLRNYISKNLGTDKQVFYIKNVEISKGVYVLRVLQKYKVIYKIGTDETIVVDNNEYFVGDEITFKGTEIIDGQIVRYWKDQNMNYCYPGDKITMGGYFNIVLTAEMSPATITYDVEKNAFVFIANRDRVYTGINKKYYSYNSYANLLTLKNGFSYDGHDYDALYLEDINVQIDGNVNLTSKDVAFNYMYGTMIGEGTLNVTGAAYFADAIINGPTIKVTSDTYEAVRNYENLQLIAGKIIAENTSTTPYPAFTQIVGAPGNFLLYYKNGDKLALSQLVKTTDKDGDPIMASATETAGIITTETYVELHPLKMLTKPTKANGYTIITSPEAASYEWYKIVNELIPLTTNDLDYGDYGDFAPVDGILPCPAMGLIAVKESVFATAKKIQITTDLNLYDGVTGELADRTVQGDKYVYVFDILEGVIEQPVAYFYTENDQEINLEDIKLFKEAELVETTTQGKFTPDEDGDYYCIARLNYGYVDSRQDYSIRLVPTAIESNLFKSIALVSLAIGACYIITRKKDNE